MYIWEVNQLKIQIGKIIQLFRLRKKLSQLQLANELNLSSNHIGRIERAETNTTIENIVKLCKFLEIDILILFSPLDDNKLKSLNEEIIYLQKEFKNFNKRKI